MYTVSRSFMHGAAKKLVSVCLLAMLVNIFPSNEIISAQSAPGNPELSRQIASEGMVLLKNENQALPLKSGEKIALFGVGQIDFIKGGGGSGNIRPKYTINLLQGMQKKEQEGKTSIYKPLADVYQKYVSSHSADAAKMALDEMPLTEQQVADAAAQAVTAIITIKRYSKENMDRDPGKGDFELDNAEADMVSKVTSKFKKVIVVLNIGGVIESSWFKNNADIDSVLLAWQPGMEGGNAVADILCGDVNPSGKLTDTFARSYTDYPSSNNFSETKGYVNYEEDIFVGYRYFETFDPGYSKVNYEFGFGLSYTNFEIRNVNTTVKDKNIEITADVKNAGNKAGKEVVQAYFSAPQGKLGKPAKELAAYAKTKLLAPGETQTLTMSYTIDDMSSYDDTGKVQKSAYVMEAGDYNIYVGNSVRNAGSNGVRYTYHLDKTTVTKQLTEQLRPLRLEKRLLADGKYENLQNWPNETGKENPSTIKNGVKVPASGSVKIEGEDFTEADTRVRIQSYQEGNAAGACLGYLGEKNAWVSFTLDVEEAGAYEIQVRMANKNNLIKEGMLVLVDGIASGAYDMPQTSSTSWYTFIDMAPFTITLPKGITKLKIANNSTDTITRKFGNIDYFTIKKAGQTQTAQNITVSNSQAKTSADTAGTGTKTVDANGNTDIENTKSAGSQTGSTKTSAGTVPNTKIMLKDVYYDRSKMDAFIAQLTNGQLIELSLGQPVKVQGGTGGIGNIQEYGIPNVQTSDGPAGLRLTEPNTAWPCSTLVACTWDTELVGKMGAAVAAEAKTNKVDIWLAPGMNIHRNPLNGRNFEYYSEDPLVTGKTAAAITRGAQENGLAVTLKHFFANNREEDRKTTDSRISERAVREIYLKGFEIAVTEAEPWCIMSSYNLVNGKGTSENGELLTNILRSEWNFKGIVMTDWGNQKNPALEVKAGNNVRMPSRDAAHTTDTKIILNALSDGTIDRSILERNIKPILEIIMKTMTFKRQILDAEVPAVTNEELPKAGNVPTEGSSMAIIFGSMAVLLLCVIPVILIRFRGSKTE